MLFWAGSLGGVRVSFLAWVSPSVGVLFSVSGVGLVPSLVFGLAGEVQPLAEVGGVHGAALSGGGADGEHPVVLGHGPYPGGLEPV